MGLHFTEDEHARQGGLDITISLTPHEASAIGVDASTLADWFDTLMYALVLLRTGTTDRTGEMREATEGDWYTVINDLEYRLTPRLKGIRDAAIRAHKRDGGTLDGLALAMDVVKSTAQYRRSQVLDKEPTVWEDWATKAQQNRDQDASKGE